MKKPFLIILLAMLAIILFVAATATVAPGKRIKDYPVNDNPSTNARYVMEKGDFSTNENISHGRLNFLFTNSLTAALNSKSSTNTTTLISNTFVTLISDTSNFLYSTSFFAGSNLVVVLSGTNTLVSKTSTNGTNFYIVNADPFAITNGLASTNFALQAASNRVVILSATNTTVVLTSTNGTNFYAVSSSASASASSIGLNTNLSLMTIQKFPQDGSLWYSGTNGIPDTNGQRSAFEYVPALQALNVGALDNNNGATRFIGAISNWWHPTNMGFGSVRFGSNSLVQSTYASVLGGQFNQIANNSPASAIVSGTNNWISTNSAWSFIGSGSGNLVQINSIQSAIVGGTGNEIIAGNIASFIGGGGGNSIADGSSQSVIVGGINNQIKGSGSSYAYIGGGQENLVQSISSRSAIVGGDGNAIGEAASTAAVRSFIGGGQRNWIRGGAHQSVLVGGFNNIIYNSSPNSFLGGGWTNSIGDSSGGSVICGGVSNIIGNSSSNCAIMGGSYNVIGDSSKHSFILGVSNVVNGKSSGAIGTFNTVSVDRGIAIGTGLAVADAGMVTIGNLSSYATSQTIAGAGNGNTNYTLQALYSKMNLGSSNVNIVAVMQTITGQSQRWRVAITNDSPNTWGFSASSTTNRWFWQSYMYGTNAPVVLTNNTRLVIDGESEGTNTWAEYKYYSPAK